MTPSDPNRTRIFISYSHKDAVWLERLQVHLKPLERDNIIERWDDTRIKTGQHWRKEIEQAIHSARISILLISADFLASDFIANNELPPLLSAAKQKGLVIMPVILKPCRYAQNRALSSFQAFNDPSKPLLELSEGKQEALWVKLTEAIEQAISQMPTPIKSKGIPDIPEALSEQHVHRLTDIFVQRSFQLFDDRPQDVEKLHDFKVKLYEQIFGHFDQKVTLLPEVRETYVKTLFDRILVFEQLKPMDISEIRKIRDDAHYHWADRYALVGALTVSLATTFDVARVKLLIDFTMSFEENVWQMALTGLLIGLHRFDRKLDAYPQIVRRLKKLQKIPEVQEGRVFQ